MTNENITHLVDKAHLILNAHTIDAAFISTIATSTLSGSDPIIISLITLLEDFHETHKSCDAKAALEQQPKCRVCALPLESNDPFQVHPQDVEPVTGTLMGGLMKSWQIHGYFHERYVLLNFHHPHD